NDTAASELYTLSLHDALPILGEFEFRANCAFCHGLGARGGGRGPDLTRTPKKHGDSDADIFNTIISGVPGTAMPPNGATQQGVRSEEHTSELQSRENLVCRLL